MTDTRFEQQQRPRPSTIDSGSLWTGGAATAVVAALVAVVGVTLAFVIWPYTVRVGGTVRARTRRVHEALSRYGDDLAHHI